MRITPFVRPWSTTTINESCLLEGGRSVMRSTESCLKGNGKEEGMGASGGQVGWWLTLFCWHIAHPEMKVLTKEESPGHQKSRSKRALVRNRPACPVVGESCMERTMACRSCGGMYMRPLKYRWPLVICQSSLEERRNRGDPTFRLSNAQSTRGSDSEEDRIFWARARSSAWIMTGSGQIDDSWLSRVVSTWSHLDSASAGAILVPGVTCHWISKSCKNSDHLAWRLDSLRGSLM